MTLRRFHLSYVSDKKIATYRLNMVDNKMDAKPHVFKDDIGDKFHFWTLTVEAVLREKNFVDVFYSNRVVADKEKKEISIIVVDLGDKPFRAYQGCKTRKAMWQKLQAEYAGRSVSNRLGLLTMIINTRWRTQMDTIDYVATLESQLSEVQSMGSTIEKLITVELVLSSGSDLN